ncbi:hypothetical protein BKA70DRAFT_1527409 [Coprinopsis sp. MPI-PUGE-AT-0042]|nr:hypothetical protein BKA70DRAFT_1527409 [Coprinopsis sp. MPI-PUGE-AT-0042]
MRRTTLPPFLLLVSAHDTLEKVSIVGKPYAGPPQATQAMALPPSFVISETTAWFRWHAGGHQQVYQLRNRRGAYLSRGGYNAKTCSSSSDLSVGLVLSDRRYIDRLLRSHLHKDQLAPGLQVHTRLEGIEIPFLVLG